MTLSMETALGHHRAGRLREAHDAYAVLLRDRPGDPDLVGLMGILALQEGADGEAERLLTVALSAGGSQTVILRNMNALGTLLARLGRLEDLRSLLQRHVSEPVTAPATQVEAGTLASLASCCLLAEEPVVAGRLADALEASDMAVVGGRREEVAVLFAKLGRQEAIEKLPAPQTAEAERDLWLKVGLAAESRGHPRIRRLAERRLARSGPFFRDLRAPRRGEGCRVLVLNWLPSIVSPDPFACYHAANAIGALAQTAEDGPLAFDSLMLGEPSSEEAVPHIPPPDVVFNNVVNAEMNILSDNLERVSRIAERFGVPVLNHPRAAALTSRQDNFRRLSDIGGVLYPKTTTYFLDGGSPAFLADSIALEFGLPVIIRSVTAHAGEGIFLCRDRPSLMAAVEGFRGRYFYAIQFIDCAAEPGIWRKFRIACFGDRMLGHKLSFGDEWLVQASAWRRLGPLRPDLQAEEARFLSDPFGYIGGEAERAIREIRRRTSLDYFGIDFTIDRAGRVVVFEVNAAMRTLPLRFGRTPFPYLDANRAKIRKAFETLLLEAAERGQRERDGVSE